MASYYYNPSKRLSEWAATFLSPYIQLENEDGQNERSRLSVGLWSGHVQLKNVELRPEAFDKFLNPPDENNAGHNEYGTKVRWKIVRGTVNDISIRIPWKRLLVGSSSSGTQKKAKQEHVGGGQSVSQSQQYESSSKRDTIQRGEKDQPSNQYPEGEANDFSAGTTVQIEGVCLILGYEVIHEDPHLDTLRTKLRSNDDAQSNHPLHDVNSASNQSKSLIREEKNRILQTAERRLLAGLEPFPTFLTETLQSDVQFALQSSIEQSLSQTPRETPFDQPQANVDSSSISVSYRSKVENYLSSAIKSLLWRTFESLSISVTCVRLSLVGSSHYDKKIKVLSHSRGVKNLLMQRSDKHANATKQQQSLQEDNEMGINVDLLRAHKQFASANMTWSKGAPYPATTTPKKITTRKDTGSKLEEFSDEDNHAFNANDVSADNVVGADDEESTTWSQEGHVELGFTLDKLDVRPGSVSSRPQMRERDDDEQTGGDVSRTSSVKLLRFRRLGLFVRRRPFSLLVEKDLVSKRTQTKKEEKCSFDDVEHDDFVIIPANIEAECILCRYSADGDATTITSTRTPHDCVDDLSTQKGQERIMDVSSDVITLSDGRSNGTTERARRAKRDKIRRNADVPRLGSTSTIHTLESDYNEAYLMPKHLEMNWAIGHVRSIVSSRHIYLLSSLFTSIARSKNGRPPTRIRTAKEYDMELIERMAEEGRPVITALDARMLGTLPQLRPQKYSRHALLTLPHVVPSWWWYAYSSVVIELKKRDKLLNDCSDSSLKWSANRKTEVSFTPFKLHRWNWQEQSRIRKEYIESYLLVQKSPTLASRSAAELRLEELEDALSVERILLLRSISRALSLSSVAKDSTEAFHIFSSTTGQTEKRARASLQPKKTKKSTETDSAFSQSGDAVSSGSPTKSYISKGSLHNNPLLFCTSVVMSGFSLALCELHDIDENGRGGVDLPDDISALTGFSDSVDLASLHQSSQWTLNEKFDSTFRFWSNDQFKFRHEPIALMHVSDISLSAQKVTHINQKYRLSIGGVRIQKDVLPSNTVISTGNIPGLNNETFGDVSHNLPCVSSILSFDGSSPASTFVNVSSSTISIDWEWIKNICSFVSANKDLKVKSNLVPLYKEDSLRRVVSNPTLTSRMSISFEWGTISVNIPVYHHRKETADDFILTLNKLQIRAGYKHETDHPLNIAEGDRNVTDNHSYEILLAIDQFSANVKPQTDSSSCSDTNPILKVLKRPVTIQVRSFGVGGCRSFVVDVSPMLLMISELRLTTMAALVHQFLPTSTVDAEEYLQPKLPAMSDYKFNEMRLCFQSIGLYIFRDVDECEITGSPTLSAQQQLKETIASFITLMSFLDFQFPNQDAIDCLAKLCADQCFALGLSQDDARNIIDAAKLSFQSELKSELGGSSGEHLFSKTLFSRKIKSLPDTMERIITKATERAISSVSLFDSRSASVSEGLFIDTEAVSVSLSMSYCRNVIQAKSKSFAIRNGLGVNLFNVRTKPVVSLSSHRIQAKRSRQDIYFDIESADATFDPETYLNALKLCEHFKMALRNVDKFTEGSTETPKFITASDFTLNGKLSSLSVIITDNLIPFARFKSSNLSLKYSLPSDASFLAKSFLFQCVSPTGAETYPDIITTYESNTKDDSEEHQALAIHFSRISDTDEVSMNVCLDGVRITLVRQFVNEILQYTDHGLSLLYNNPKRPEVDTDESTSPNDQNVTIRISNSSIVLPRDTKSVDIVGIEVKEISISTLRVSSSWSIDSYTFRDDSSTSLERRAHEVESTRSSSSEVFFDCVDEQISTTLSALYLPRIPRISVQIEGARVFTALNNQHHSPYNVNLCVWNRVVFCTGRAEKNKRAFAAKGNVGHALDREIQSRVWEEITLEPLSLDIKADFAPTLRLMIEDNCFPGRLSLDMRMSQLYLIMSIWFCNMQELPLLFPYDSDYVEKFSTPPSPPVNWPEYGSDEFVKWLKNPLSQNTTEIALCIKNISWRISYDHPGYFVNDPPTLSMIGSDTLTVSLGCAICSIMSEDSGVFRVGIGATSMKILDERGTETSFKQEATVTNVNNTTSFVDLQWGLHCGRHSLIEGLPLPFQMTVFMTPDNNCMINLGADMLETNLENLSSIWVLLDYFGLYFKDFAFGHPAFVAEKLVHEVFESVDSRNDCLDVDFRLFLTRPHQIIPSPSGVHGGVCIMLEASGLHYRYKSFGPNYSSQTIVTNDLAIVAMGEYRDPSTSRGLRQVSGCLRTSGAQTLIDGLSFSIQYAYNENANFTKFALRIPLSRDHFDSTTMIGIEPSEINVEPYQCQAPLVCKPVVSPSRIMKKKFVAHFSYEYMKLAFDVINAFVGPIQAEDDPVSDLPERKNLFSIAVHVEGGELIISDPVMGMHRPILSISVPSLLFTASQLQEATENNVDTRGVFASSDRSDRASESLLNCASDFQACVEVCAFVDYFKLAKTRNWEPLIEPFKCLILYEKSQVRGKGVTINIDCPLHCNITGALIETIDDARDTFEMFLSSDPCMNYTRQNVRESTLIECLHSTDILHACAEHIKEQERRAFALKNSTGQQIRVHTLSSIEKTLSGSSSNRRSTIYYLDHSKTMPLFFPATFTAIRNLKPIEIPIEDRNPSGNDTPSNQHVIDIQIPGFQWLHGVSIEETGRKFLELVPRSLQVQSKINSDWRLKNGVQVLADVQCVNGGRRLSLHSPFEVVNKTNHTISLSFSPNPRAVPDIATVDSEEINPDESYIVPHLLLESALRLEGSHLGSFWMKPKQIDDLTLPGLFNGRSKEMTYIDYPSRPIQLSKILHETSTIWSTAKGNPSVANQFASGTEISCPVFDTGNNRQTIPFCYVVEIKRSPLAPQKKTEENDVIGRELFSPTSSGKGQKITKSKISRTADTTYRHRPVLYSLLIHPPIVIQNLLPEHGRFELMHATNKSVLWWGILEAGEKVHVHTVGLDAPMVLLVNLGFCRTPHDEGALVHPGGGGGLFRAGWNSLGNVMKTSKDKMKKTLFTVTASKDTRGAGRVLALKSGMNKKNDAVAIRKVRQLGFSNEENEADEKVNGSMLYGHGYEAENVDSETTVIDSLGQRLILHIDNVIGGGGQRFITLYCPYWILNTTSHSLRYKQEKVSSFVSGTVLSPGLDGSKRVDGSSRNDEDKLKEFADHSVQHGLDSLRFNTIFSGRPGALNPPDNVALEPAILAALISEDLPLSIMSRLAFMFNFQETLSLGSPPRLCVQLADTTGKSRYTSAWSSGFGLESVGVTQIVGMHCKDGRRLEVSISITIAPGRLSNYTKIVRICPRRLPMRMITHQRLWQDNSMLHPNKPVEQSSQSNESEKWIFSLDGCSSDDAQINEYRALFGEQIRVDSCRDSNLLAETTAHHAACYIATIHPSELISFHLPDTRIDRLLRFEYGTHWNLSCSIPADVTGEYYLTITRAMDLRILPHVSTRAAPVYTVNLPSPDKEWNGELGAWFETDWGREKTLIVKGVKEGSFASYFTDISVGDELICIDDTPVDQLKFEEAMKLLKMRLSSIKETPESTNQLNRTFQQRKKSKCDDAGSSELKGCVRLTFKTLEERMRSLRRKAVVGRVARSTKESRRSVLGQNDTSEKEMQHSKDLVVDMRFLFQSIFIFIREPNAVDPPHKIVNRSLQWAIYYRQRNCDSHPWSCLYPGESAAYTWQEPTKPKKLSVRVGICEWIFGSNKSMNRLETDKSPFYSSFHFIKDEEQGFYGVTKTIKLEEIGYVDRLPCPERTNGEQAGHLYCLVDAEGTTRVLIISDELKGSQSEDQILIQRHIINVRKEIATEERRRKRLDDLGKVLTTISTSDVNQQDEPIMSNFDSTEAINLESIESELEDIVDYGEGQYITKRHQVLVQVLEATGLISSDLNGLSNPYVTVSLKQHRTGGFKKNDSRRTYFVGRTLSPSWSRQIFVFDVPAKAAHDPKETRKFSIQCTVKSKEKLNKDKFLGQVKIQLRDLILQQENVGWYPLMGKLGQRDVDAVDRIRGSIKVRLQYITDYQGLIDYYRLCSDRHIETLTKTKLGMRRQLKVLRESAKQEEETKEALLGVPALTMIGRKKRRVSSQKQAPDDRFIQPSRIIQGMRDGTESRLKKSLDIAKSVVQRRKRVNPKKNSFVRIDECSIASQIVEDPHTDSDYSKSDECDDLDQIASNSDDQKMQEQEGIADAIIDRPADIVNSQGVTSSSRLNDLRDRCWSHRFNPPTMISAQPPHFLSWNISRAFVRAKASHSTQYLPAPLPVRSEKCEDHFADIVHILKPPPSAPSRVRERETNHLSSLIASRTLFSKKARGSLNCVLNPGGVLTIRPITALNLPDDYTGMFIKLRYGTTIRISETVDSKVAPVWTDEDRPIPFSEARRNSRMNAHKKTSRRSLLRRKTNSSDLGPSEFADIAEIVNPLARWGRPQKNDLEIEVAPFETSKSLRLSVIGEKIQSSVELGILDIELGPALECCTQCQEEFEEDRASPEPKGFLPAYIRWFPLTPPSDAIAVEGDMGHSTRPKESEKMKDDMFTEYFTPCIKLALMFKPHSDDIAGGNQHTNQRKRSSTHRYLYAKLHRLSAALIDSNRVNVGELLSFTSRDADLRLSVTKAKTRVSFAVGYVQVDQQRMAQDCKAPVVLAPIPVKHPQPFVQFLVWKDNTRSKQDMDSFEYVALEVQDIDLKIEETWLFDLWEFYVGVTTARREARTKSRDKNEGTTETAQDRSYHFMTRSDEELTIALTTASTFLMPVWRTHAVSGHLSISKKVYIRELILGYMKISLSYFKSPRIWSAGYLDDEFTEAARYELFLSPNALAQRISDKTTSDEAYKQWSENTPLAESEERSPLSTINIISAIFPSISDASIRFQGKLIEHVFETQDDVWRSLRTHYSSEALKQIYKIVGSLDFVGNPTMLLTSFRTGLRDFILQPSRELKYITRNPSRVGVGVIKGTVSLFSNSASGIFGFFSNLGSTAGQTATMLTLDEHFRHHHNEKQTAQQRHYERWKRKGCGHVTLIITRPIHDLVFGVLSATTGLLTEPYRGAKQHGIVGLGKGVGVGIIGLVVKPVVGIFDAFSHIMGSIHDIAKSVNILEARFKPIERYRLPYTFGASNMLLAFNPVQSKSAQLLLAYPLDKKLRKIDEVIVASQALHVGPRWDQYIVVTTRRIVLFKLKDIDGTGFVTSSLDWQVRFEKGHRVSSSLGTKGHNRVILSVSKSNPVSEQGDHWIGLPSSEDYCDKSFHVQSKFDSVSSMDLGRSYSIETPKNFGPASTAFRLRNARLLSNSDPEGILSFAVEGHFGQRPQLSQIHNAICCLTGDFSNLIFESRYGTPDETLISEGITSFGNLTFERQKNTGKSKNEDPKILRSLLESTYWKHPVSPPFQGHYRAPSWFTEAFEQALFVPLQQLHLPSNIDPVSDKRVSSLLSELECGLRTFESCEQEIRAHAHSLTFAPIKEELHRNSIYACNSVIGSEGVSMAPGQFTFSDYSSDDSHDKSATEPMLFPDQEVISQKTPNDSSPVFKSTHLDCHTDISNDTNALDSRLRRVEVVLENLVSGHSHNLIAIRDTDKSSKPLDQESPSYCLEKTQTLPSIQQMQQESHVSRAEASEVEVLRREISNLKRQLAHQGESYTQAKRDVAPGKKLKYKPSEHVANFFKKNRHVKS
eukprot:CCRYP_010930-RC/>CCRYP_010930-RC protein AED:0.04 eAED:0.04 QI:95/1/1/1/0.91/0.91/24/65/5640